MSVGESGGTGSYCCLFLSYTLWEALPVLEVGTKYNEQIETELLGPWVGVEARLKWRPSEIWMAAVKRHGRMWDSML